VENSHIRRTEDQSKVQTRVTLPAESVFTCQLHALTIKSFTGNNTDKQSMKTAEIFLSLSLSLSTQSAHLWWPAVAKLQAASAHAYSLGRQLRHMADR